jgi:hypothetical protein
MEKKTRSNRLRKIETIYMKYINIFKKEYTDKEEQTVPVTINKKTYK